MAITWTEGADSRQNLGPSGIMQVNKASFSVSDYPVGGYPIYPSAFGLSHITFLIPVGYGGGGVGAGYPAGYVWQYLKPLIEGPANSNPGFLIALEQNGLTGSLVPVSASNANFAAGSLDLCAFGY